MDCVYQNGPISIFKVTESVYFRHVDFRSTQQCNSVFLVGQDAVGVVDISQEVSCAQMEEEADLLFHKEIRYAFLTHRHGDHIGGLPRFLNNGKTIFLSHNSYRHLDEARRNSGAVFVPLDSPTRIDFSGILLELDFPVGIMHCDGEMLIRILSENAICTGDCVIDFREFYCYDGDICNWIYELEHLPCSEDCLILPGHGMPMGKDGLKGMEDNLHLMLRAVKTMRSALTQKQLTEISSELVKKAVQSYLESGSEEAGKIIKISRGWAEEHLEMVFWYSLHHSIEIN